MNRVNTASCAALVIGGIAAGVILRHWLPDRCTPPTEADKSRLANFVRLEYKLPAGAHIGVADAGIASASCFRKLVFASLSGRPFRAELFVSPDFRLLTDKLLDTRPDPRKAEEEQRKTEESLTRSSSPLRGAAEAPVTLALFSDFQCPYCARMASVVDGLTKSEGSRLRIVYHYFPLTSIHPWANQAAEAAACAQRESNSTFWGLHDFLFARQRRLTPKNLKEHITDWERTMPSLNRQRFERCVSESLASGQIEQDVALGQELGVQGTPTVFINGELVDASSQDELRVLIRRAAAGQ